MAANQQSDRCWLCDAALWLFPIWTWVVVCATSVFMLALLRPDAIGGCLALMGVLLVVIGICVHMLMEERTRERELSVLAAKSKAPK
jgi:hypothetical protein